jgi:hypothetical protein
LLLARSIWLLLAALQLVSFVPLLPHYLPRAQHPCPANCLLTVQQAHSLTRAGISLNVYVGSLLVVAVLNLLLAATMAGILFVRRSHEVMALITAYFVLVLPTSILFNYTPIETGFTQATAFALPPVLDRALAALQTAAIYGMLLLFPSGRFVPRRSWALLVGFVAFTLVWNALAALQGALVLGWPVFLASAAACMGYRYWHVSTPVERQQTKWVLVGFLTILLTNQGSWLPTFTPLGTTVYAPLSYLGYELLLSVLPITFFVAIQRYRLYDIDVIIRRTLVYGTLTTILVGVYFVGVVGTQMLVGRIAGQSTQQEPILIVVTTLVIAALFQPLRRFLQRSIDRHFYRTKYDVERTLVTFGAALRSDVDLDHLRGHLATVVEETMHPEHASLWLRAPDRAARGSHGPP